MKWLVFGICLLVGVVSAFANEPLLKLTPIGQVSDEVREASGLCKSRRHAGLFWTISDSGNSPTLYAITRTGKPLAQFRVRDAINLDWESIDADDDGFLWIGDVGNNLLGGPLKVRWVYQVREPDPFRLEPRFSEQDTPPPMVAVERQLHVQYPAEPRDVEGMFVRQQQLFLVSKRAQAPTELFRGSLAKDAGDVAENNRRPKPQTLGLLATWPAGLRVTGAALDPCAKRLALCSYDHVTVIRLPCGLDSLSKLAECESRTIRFQPTSVEGCEWDGDDLLLVSEDRNLYCLRP